MRPFDSTSRRLAMLAGSLFAAACANGEPATAPMAPMAPIPTFLIGPGDAVAPTRTEVTLCKVGSDATFDVGGVAVGVTNGDCVTVASGPELLDSAIITITETGASGGATLDSIVRVSSEWEATNSPAPFDTVRTVLTGTNSSGASYGKEWGTSLVFYNSVKPSGGGEGCTPGYWKQPHHFDSWPAPYTPGMLFSSVFEDAFPGMTLLDVLRQGGGGLKALGRHTVAALLNAASGGVSYDLSDVDVINGFNAVFPGGDYEGQKNLFAGFNEQGCPLN